jgi:hypothetical protein
LFSITDNLSGSLMSVNTIAGLPVIEVFSDNNVNIGKYNGEAIRVTGSGVDVALGSGSVMFVSGSKKVGINTTNLTNTLTVAGDISASGAVTSSTGFTGYTMQMNSIAYANFTLVDATPYYFGHGGIVNNASIQGFGRIYVPKEGVVKSVYVMGTWANSSQSGSAETWSMSLLVNGTTSSSISTTGSSGYIRTWSNTNMNVSVAVGDYLEIKSEPVTWATNPICAVYYGFRGTIYIE